MRLPSLRGLFVAIALTLMGAVAATLIEATVSYAVMASTLHDKFGLPFDEIYVAVAGGPIWQGIAETFFAYAVLVWPLAGWRLPLIGSIGGLVAVEGIFLIVSSGGKSAELESAVLKMFAVGLVIIVLLRLSDWAHRRFGRVQP